MLTYANTSLQYFPFLIVIGSNIKYMFLNKKTYSFTKLVLYCKRKIA